MLCEFSSLTYGINRFHRNWRKLVFFSCGLHHLLNLQQAGEHLPAVEVQEGEPGNKVAMNQLFKGKKGVLFAVPGAFTPGCSKVEFSPFCCVFFIIVLAIVDILFVLLILDSPPRFCGAG